MKFKVGDRVKAIKIITGEASIVGKIGTVVYKYSNYDGLIVEFDEYLSFGHNGNGRGKQGYCWNGNPADFELLKGKRGRPKKEKPKYPKYLVVEESCNNLSMTSSLSEIKNTSMIYKLTPLKRLVKTTVMKEEKVKR